MKTHHAARLAMKPPLPQPDEVPLMGVRTDKDYVVSNAVEVILSPPMQCKDLKVNYLNKPDYGKIPKYLDKIRKELEEEEHRKQKQQEENEQSLRSKRRLLGLNERRELVSALKERWNKINREYQQSTHLTVLDTLSKVKRKESFEKDLEQIEKDIALIDRPESVDIYVDLES